MSASLEVGAWALEVVRGREQGRRYALSPGTTILGSTPAEPGALDLSAQETDPARRMSARQATIACELGGLQIRDLRSPGGTFVNRQRVAAGTSRRLDPGDLIQLGAVQLKVVASGAPRAAAAPAPRAARDFPFVSATGTHCRNWDDFLRYSAQHWAELRDELTSGRLAAFLHGIGRSELSPDPLSNADPDERLDQWLGRIPTTQPAAPALEVHPEWLVVAAGTGGGMVRKLVRVSNTGHRILRIRARVAEGAFLSLPADIAGRELAVVDERELPVIVQVPETAEASRGAVEITSNAGTKRVEVEVRRQAADAIEAPEPVVDHAEFGGFRQWLGGLPFWVLPLAFGGGRLVLSILHQWFDEGAASHPDVILASAVMTKVGAAAGACYKLRKHLSAWDRLASLLCGGLCGMIAATVWVACCRAIEPYTGPVPPPLVWALIGIVAALWARKGRSHVSP